MINQIQQFEYNNQVVEFEMVNGNLMINATEMGKIFGKKTEAFTRNESTIQFINAFIKSENSRFISEDEGQIKNGISRFISEKDLIISRQKSGTWMHRVLAIKFAAWLNPDFEVWIYKTIDELLFGEFKRMQEELRLSAQRKNRIDELRNQLVASDEYCELVKLELEEKQAAYRRTKHNRMQLELFRSNLN